MANKLLLCDSPHAAAQLQYALIKSGELFETEVATDGFRAVELCARIQPTVIVCDPDLEGLSGTELLRRLGGTAPRARVFVWAANGSPDAVAEALGAGAAGYLLKEEGPEAVVAAVRSVRDSTVELSPKVSSMLAQRLAASIVRERELEASVADLSEQLDRVTAAKADFLANVSHELRTPVTVAKGIAYVLKNQGISEEERDEFVGRLEASLERLMMLVDEILTIAELDQGNVTLQQAESDLAPVLRHAADEMHRQFPQVILVRELPETLTAWADPVRVGEIVRQILENACRYCDGQPVLLRARSLEEGVVVSVTDRGRGIPRDVVSAAFNEPFSTGEAILRKERDGAGVGLHMARQLVLEHGGIIWADPLPGGGSRVSFCLPNRPDQQLTRPPVVPFDPETQPTSAITSS